MEPGPDSAKAAGRHVVSQLEAVSPDPEQQARERRRKNRRDPSADRAFQPLEQTIAEGRALPTSWRYLIMAMSFSAVLAFALTRALPGLVTIAALGAALVGVALIRPVRNALREKSGLAIVAALTLVACLPLSLFGFGITRWAVMEGLPWEAALASMISVGAMAATYLRRRPAMILMSQAALWSATLVATQSLLGLAGLLVGGLLASMVSRDQLMRQQEEDQLRAAQERAQTRARDILTDYEGTGQGWFWETDRRGLITYVSTPVAKVLGCDPEDLIGQPLVTLFDLSDDTERGERTLIFHLSTRSAFHELAVRAADVKDDRWWSISGRPIYDKFDNFTGFRGSGTDLTERKRSQEEVSRLANFDSLTGLSNRFQINRVLEKILSAQAKDKRACAIFLLDLDRFKHVNDTMGHPAGDALLKQVAQRLERAVGKMGQVGRLGGDEFKVVIPGTHARQILSELAREVIHSLSQPYAIEGQRVTIGASVGIAMAPENGDNAEDVIRNADLALYAAKDGGRGRYHFYAEDLHAEAEARSQLEEDLRDAITRGELQMAYQPVVSTATEKITGFEALLRWHHPVKGWISPQRFIGVAEDTGLIAQLGEWALRTACADVARMPAKLRVAVNVSPLQFANPELPTIVTQAIAQAGIEPSQLELEITESVFLSDDEGTDAMFKALKGVGVRLALDDFGTGYSSLGYLKTAPFDKIKIDQSFVRGATQEGSRNGAIIASITSLAHALGMEITAEGVETLDELELVRLHGCSHVQGYIYERALDADAAITRLQSGLVAVARGPKASRAPRQTMLRKVVLDHGGNLYDGTVRNISTTGAMVEGLWNVPVGTIFRIQLSQDYLVTCTTRWSTEDRMGVEFADPLQRDNSGSILAVQGAPPIPVRAKIAATS
ncbi:EAL domain-containing protein [Alteraurantiacibacter aquimixticola]|uniref:EAL domain-containing protein n=1 Tax=Alteraurantiacibacter aquimixticola TaxID=2489173 RepID=A0A4V6UGB0_9SPHN|nr:EAL domain-containing protein [Alteraurantiacibacter aquimixticola]TIX50273.1 EAL domain-containing protein [Alteraurantiacibacter aquimixticola]